MLRDNSRIFVCGSGIQISGMLQLSLAPTITCVSFKFVRSILHVSAPDTSGRLFSILCYFCDVLDGVLDRIVQSIV